MEQTPSPNDRAGRLPVEIYLNSSNSIQVGDGYHNDCSFQLPRTIQAGEGWAIYLSVLSFTCPVSWTLVNTWNNTLMLNGLRYDLRPGHYSAFQLAAAIRATIPPTVSCVFDPITLKMCFSSEQPVTYGGSLLGPLGMEPAVGTYAESRHTVDLSGVNSIYFMTDFISHNVDTRPGDPGNVMCRIPIDVPPLSVCQYLDQNGSIGRPGVLLADGQLSSIRVRLEDEYRRPLQASIFWEATMQCVFVPSGRAALQIERPLALAIDPVKNMWTPTQSERAS